VSSYNAPNKHVTLTNFCFQIQPYVFQDPSNPYQPHHQPFPPQYGFNTYSQPTHDFPPHLAPNPYMQPPQRFAQQGQLQYQYHVIHQVNYNPHSGHGRQYAMNTVFAPLHQT
jgi:hypothetical protein